ncbi:4Fe-4S binding protein [Desulforamulus ruminis]|uniref:4Fe-4S ferredoxin iron-sulfur binding domain protein n=1 Tax=Desulforamulus ruminis (strain ATCC 23193 / DSM 2154 / NCIMB 8452 / DL) TaxID=696281 RepID=F6DS23_DESRL|nr:4Fe-4S binding protein [Desulforamulus ruminis]AEG58785.1 4Fe-4S ferredoxin iron-sulfur binding domain protein [Desulforamulus ruminis DSM 2154]
MNEQTKGSQWLKNILKSKWYPGIFQWPTAIVFIIIMYELLIGIPVAHDNFGTAMTWVLWWPIIPLIFLLVGRFWCAICPFATLSDLIQKWVGNNRPVPKFLKRYGIWIIDIFFILITWADHVFGIVESPRGSGVLMLLIITGVVAAGAFFERRTWCRYLCFLGGLAGNYSRAGALELRGTPEKCSQCTVFACFKGSEKAPGCPMFEFPKTMDNNARCNFCGHCVKNCPNDSISISARIPSKELWFIRKPKLEESFLAIVIMGIVFVQNITMLEIGMKAQEWLERILGISNYAVTFTVTFLVAMAIPILLLVLTSWIASLKNAESVTLNFTRFGYMLIPLDLAGHLAHNLFHLLAEGKSVFYTFLALFGRQTGDAATALVSMETIQILQFTLLSLGTLASVYTAYRIAKTSYTGNRVMGSFIPFALLVLLLAALNIYLFLLPMTHRM